MQTLNAQLLNSSFAFPSEMVVPRQAGNLPERVIQFGEGNFLRAFVDLMLHQLNQQGLFNGRIVVLSPRGNTETIDKLNAQDGLYTVLLRGLKDGRPAQHKEIVSAISRGLNPYTQWQQCLACAEQPEIEFVISNTTEAGIVYNPNDRLDMAPPASFPAKLTVYLYHRFQHFKGDADKGMVIMPCELIEDNGTKLREIILQYADAWQLPAQFKRWISEHNIFLNTLVDRVVTGYPHDEIEALEAELGYRDQLLVAGELFHFLAVEGPEQVAKRLPFAEIGLNVVWDQDITPYRTRKVRILNGAHTASVPASFLYGLDTVGEMMDDPVMGQFVRQAVYEEIIPSISLDKGMLTEFADAVIERFRNPFIKHYLLSILLNSAAKFKARVLPSILEYKALHGTLPKKLTFSLAALMAVYKGGKADGTSMQAARDKGPFVMKDDAGVLAFMAQTWASFDGSKPSLRAVVEKVLANTAIWGQDLNEVSQLAEQTAAYLEQIVTNGMPAAAAQLVGKKQ